MQRTDDTALDGVDLRGDRYRVVQSVFRNKYTAYDEDGALVLRGKQKFLKLKEEFPFVDADGNPAFTVTAGSILDVAGDYTLVDDRTDEPVVVLDKQWTLFTHRWKLRDPETEALIAEITSKNKLVAVLRGMVGLFKILPHKYEITAADGSHVGHIEGQFSIKDKYDVVIDDAGDVPREAIVAAAMVMDAIEGN